MSAHAVATFETAQRYFIAGGFGQDLEKLDGALKMASAAAAPVPPMPSTNKQ